MARGVSSYSHLPLARPPARLNPPTATLFDPLGAQVVSRFDVSLASSPADVGLETGATIHTANGLPVRLTPRRQAPVAAALN